MVMNLGILQCDSIREEFVAQYGQYPAMIAALLHTSDPSIEFSVFNVKQGELPNHVDAADAYIITGSRDGVNDGHNWIEQLEQFVRDLYHARKKVIGICFGHQIIAKAMGGQVIKSPKGWGLGMSQNTLLVDKSWMNPKQSELNILVSHQDQVVELPEGAEVLAGSEFCPYYMLQLDSFLTIQGHPEFTKDYAKALIITREDHVSKIHFTKAMDSLSLNVHDALIAQWIVAFLSHQES